MLILLTLSKILSSTTNIHQDNAIHLLGKKYVNEGSPHKTLRKTTENNLVPTITRMREMRQNLQVCHI